MQAKRAQAFQVEGTAGQGNKQKMSLQGSRAWLVTIATGEGPGLAQEASRSGTGAHQRQDLPLLPLGGGPSTRESKQCLSTFFLGAYAALTTVLSVS